MNVKEEFKKHCGEKFDKFVGSIYINEAGKIELKFWQEQLAKSFLQSNSDLDLTPEALVDQIRDGSERIFDCPVEDCWGHVICIDRTSGQWGCCECGETYDSVEALVNAIAESR